MTEDVGSRMRELIARGSLGTPEARALRATVSRNEVQRVLALARRLREDRAMTLTEFLLARIAEDETKAIACADAESGQKLSPTGGWENDPQDVRPGKYQALDYSNMLPAAQVHMATWNPARVLAECEAKRRILAIHYLESRTVSHDIEDDEETTGCGYCFGYGDSATSDDNVPACPTLRATALPYADHPDYQPEWAPSPH